MGMSRANGRIQQAIQIGLAQTSQGLPDGREFNRKQDFLTDFGIAAIVGADLLGIKDLRPQ